MIRWLKSLFARKPKAPPLPKKYLIVNAFSRSGSVKVLRELEVIDETNDHYRIPSTITWGLSHLIPKTDPDIKEVFVR